AELLAPVLGVIRPTTSETTQDRRFAAMHLDRRRGSCRTVKPASLKR
ncbi:hypothetical protein MRX96_056928, partial [Rhipicephalus microplus]